MAKVLVIRTSSLGDIALLVPVVFSVASRYPQDRFVVMTRQAFTPLFSHLGFNISTLPLDTNKRHKGVWGLFKMLLKTNGKGFTHVADVHNVLRSKVIRSVMKLTFTQTAKIDKGRAEKKLMTQEKNTSKPLKHTTQRYLDVFTQLGFPAEIIFEDLFSFKPKEFKYLKNVTGDKHGTWIGIAPFAQHKGKVLPDNKIEELIEAISQRENTSIFIFGGCNDMAKIHHWSEKYPNIIKHGGKINLELELLLISYLDVMISMDSANMHLASLVNVPVVSIWGATHPALGFYGFRQDIDNAVQADLSCRPCSVFGNTPCPYQGEEEYKCLKMIDSQSVISKVEKVLENKKS